jgi:hypothetical protein
LAALSIEGVPLNEGTVRRGKSWQSVFELTGDQQMVIFRSTGETRPSRGYSFVHVIYLVAIVAATFGWLWLIAWCALQLI